MRTIEEILEDLDRVCPRISSELRDHFGAKRIREMPDRDATEREQRLATKLPDAYAKIREVYWR
jgi:hypothetical protein